MSLVEGTGGVDQFKAVGCLVTIGEKGGGPKQVVRLTTEGEKERNTRLFGIRNKRTNDIKTFITKPGMNTLRE